MSKSLQELRDNIITNINNPSYTVMKTQEFIMDIQQHGYDISDAGSPFVSLMEAGAVMASSAVDVHNLSLGKLYSSLATTRRELYIHLNKGEFNDIFSLPQEVLFTIYIEVDTIIRYGVETSNYKEVKIANGAKIKTSDGEYILDREYTIRIIDGNVIKVFTTDYNGNTIITPSNIVGTPEGVDVLRFNMNALHLTLVVGSMDVIRSGAFNKSINIPSDTEFSRLEAFSKVNDVWKPLNTTFSEDHFDRFNPLVHITPLEDSVEIYIPPIYTREGIMGNNLLVLLYTTSLNTSNDFVNTPSDKLRMINKDPMLERQTNKVQAMSKTTFYLVPNIIIRDKRPSLTLAELHDRVVNKAQSKHSLPLTNKQIITEILNLGYAGVLYNPHRTQLYQSWLLTSEAPRPVPSVGKVENPERELITSPEHGFIKLSTSIEELGKVAGVRTYEDGVTIPPECFIKNIEGRYELQSYGYANSLSLVAPRALSKTLNEENIYYPPYYYNIYNNNGIIETRIYDFKKPNINFISTNTLTSNGSFLLLIDKVTIINQENQYLLEITTANSSTNDVLTQDDLFCNLSWMHDNTRYYITTEDITKVDGSFVIRLKIQTEFQILPNEEYMVINNALSNLSSNFKSIPFPINGDFNVTFGVKTIFNNFNDHSIDEYIHRYTSGDTRYALSLETIDLSLGRKLTYLWNTISWDYNNIEYDTYPEDVPLRYDYTSIPVSGTAPAPFSIGDSCEVIFKDPVNSGDVVVDDDGNVIYEHRKGDIVYDVSGKPVVLNIRKRQFSIDIFALNVMSWFTTGLQEEYVRHVLDDIALKSTVTIQPLVDKILEHTSMYNYPINMIGKGLTNPDIDVPSRIKLSQSLTVDITLEGQVDLELRRRLRRVIIEAIDTVLRDPIVSVTSLTVAVLDRLPSNIKHISIKGLGGSSNIANISLQDTTNRLSIAKILTPSDKGAVSMEDDVQINYKKLR